MKLKRNLLLSIMAMGLLALTGCSTQAKANVDAEEAQEIYEKVLANYASQTSLDVTANVEAVMTADGESLESTISMDIKANNIDSADLVMYMSMDIAVDSESMNTEFYYADDYYYMSMMGQNFKYEMPMTEVLEQLEAAQLEEMDFSLYKKVDLKHDGKITTISYEADPTALTDEMDSYLGYIENLGISEELISDVKVESMSGTVTLNDEFQPISADTHMVYEMLIMDETVKYDMNMTMTFNSFGEVTIDLPNADDYMEIDASMLQ